MENLNKEKARILKDSLRIVDKLGDLDDFDPDFSKVSDLIIKAKKLKKNILWRL